MPVINNKHKDRLFSFLFGSEPNKEWTLSLYNAVNGTNHTNADDILFTTMEDTIYMGMKNDLSFILCQVMNIYEQQSTYNPNMPVRQLMYAGKLYDKYIRRNNLNIYGKKIVNLPMPKLVTFYNGTEEKADGILRLSDAFKKVESDMESDIEVKVRMININYGKNKKLLGACKPLEEYAWLVEEIRDNRIFMDIEEAVDKAIEAMPDDYVIKHFLIGHKAEVKDMCITEYNEAETMRMIREESLEEGLEKGLEKGREEGLKKGREEGLEKGREEGRTFEIYSLVQEGGLSPEFAAERLGITVSVLRDKMTATGYRCPGT